MAHLCHATGCKKTVPPVMFACKHHWFMLPKMLRDAIWEHYRPGQCDDWNITHEYAKAARNAIKYLAKVEGVEPNVSVYDMLDPKAERNSV